MQDVINAYKNEIRKYKFYSNQLERYKEQKLLAEHEETGLASKVNDNDRVQGSPDPTAKALRRLQLVEIVERCEIMIGKYQQKLTSIDKSLEEMDREVSQIIKRVYCLKETTLEQESYEVGYSPKTIKRKIDDEIEKMSLSSIENVLL